MLLPAKLSFMAASYKDKIVTAETATSSSQHTCVHGIRDHGEKSLQAAADLASGHVTTNDQDKSEDEEDVSKTLVIDTADEDDSSSLMEVCDELSLRSHAARLNPSVYTTCYASVNATSTPNPINHFQPHHANTKKTSLNFNEEAKLSPRKSSLPSSTSVHTNAVSSLTSAINSSPLCSKEKRKSPCKKAKSPSNNTIVKTPKASSVVTQPMVVIHETNLAIQCAKRLKTLIEDEPQTNETVVEEPVDSKEILKIVAAPKHLLPASESSITAAQICHNVKEEDVEFLAENSALSDSPFPCLRMDTDSNEEDNLNPKTPPIADTIATTSGDDNTVDIVSSATASDTETASTPVLNNESEKNLPLNAAWTRDEDKIILIEMKIGSENRQELYHRISEKLPDRTMFEITSRHQFLMDFLSTLQAK